VCESVEEERKRGRERLIEDDTSIERGGRVI
jgi:hypothetical protein